jgi:tetratricopeptide (TPR) repeat protein
MRNRKLQMIAAVLLVCFGASVALACGWDFPWQLLDDRAATLDTMPVDTRSFAYAEAHLFPSPNDKLIAEESDEDGIAEAVHAEVAGLDSDQAYVVGQMRDEASGDSAFNKGAMLPAAVRLYTAGAVDFHNGDSAKAIARFQAILDLPASERRDRAVWAAYMLGRLYGSKNDIAEASRSFGLTRELANSGAPDPLGLGVASFGEEARLHLKRAEALHKPKKEMSPRQRREYGREIASAVRLYGEQAAHGSSSAIDSLQLVVDEMIGDDAAVEASICDPRVQRLLVTRTLDGDGRASNNLETPPTSRISWFVRSVQKCGSGNLVAADQLAAMAYRDGDYRLAQRLVSQATGPLASWVKARLAMQKGDVAEAAKYYAEASTAFPSSGEDIETLLAGERGVLTLSRGEYVDALEQLYPYSATFWGDVAYIAERVLTVDELKTFVDTHKDTKVASAISITLPIGADSEENSPSWSVRDDQSPAVQLRDLLGRRLVRAGRYQEALKYFEPPEVETSAAAVPPMVLPGFGNVVAPHSTPRAEPKLLGVGGGYQTGSGNPGIATSVDSAQREHAQMRLRVAGGMPIVRAPIGTGVLPGIIIMRPLNPAPVARQKQIVRKHFRHTQEEVVVEGNAADYVRALHDASTAQSSVDRARGWYRAATLAGDFQTGYKIMGTEGPPDRYGPGRSELHSDDRYVTDGERQRFKASASLKPDFRYHYLFVGVDEAIHAADLLPPRSQAFAAVLCHAARSMIDRGSCPASAADLRESPMAYASTTATIADPLTVDLLWPDEDTARENLTCQLYQRYLKEGTVLPWATHFGRHCPEPDFVSVVNFAQTQTIRDARRRSRILRHRSIVLMQLALIALCLGASTWWFLRHRYV